ncbi:protease [Corallococcus sp. M34]|uniref:protease n=1 Tax=Citreicoccus inhibens TaxID=2849499 RepID=UPI001C21E445|nr:protease [Citreicoccus inhibens]MBU8898657.1 protease [Citreicoccus inhibens]
MPVSLRCTMSVPSRVTAGQPVEVTFRLENPTSQPVHVLRWNTPLEGLMGNLFQVTRDGMDVPYQGPMLKRADPGATDYTTISPAGSAEGKVEASLAYNFREPGTYRIAFRDTLLDVAPGPTALPRTREGFQSQAVTCAPVETQVTKP